MNSQEARQVAPQRHSRREDGRQHLQMQRFGVFRVLGFRVQGLELAALGFVHRSGSAEAELEMLILGTLKPKPNSQRMGLQILCTVSGFPVGSFRGPGGFPICFLVYLEL